jgi:ATP-binding cassette subfamily C (CFTR/MRP) protein 1
VYCSCNHATLIVPVAALLLNQFGWWLLLLLLQMLVFYTWTVRNLADAISLFASTEKIGWMATKTPQEGEALYNADASLDGKKDVEAGGKMMVAVNAAGDGGAPAGWPRRGTIEFENVWMKYLPSAPYALKGECWVARSCTSK